MALEYDPTDPYGMKKLQQQPVRGMPGSPMGPAPMPPAAPGGMPVPQSLQGGQGLPGATPPPQAGQDQSRLLEEALLGTYGNVLENESLSDQMAQAEALRGAPAPEMRGGGRVTTAANPMEFIGRGITQYRQGRKIEDLRKRQEANRGRIGEAVKKYGLNLPE